MQKLFHFASFFVVLYAKTSLYMLQKTRGIVLHALKYKDASLIVDIYTETLGRASFMVYIPKSKKASVKATLFQPMALVELEADIRPNTSIYKVREAKSFYPFVSLPYEPRKSAIALFLSEFLYRALREEDANIPLFNYLMHSIVWLDTCKQQFSNFHLVFLMRLSRFLGLYPNLDDYVEGDYFDMRAACFSPLPPQMHSDYLQPAEAALLNKLIRMRYDTMRFVPMTRIERARFLTLINDYYRLHLPDFPVLRSLDVLHELFD